jgi:WD40 repeat protein
LWDVVGNKEVCSLRFDDKVNSVAFSVDGKRVLAGSSHGLIRLWDCASGRELCELLSFRDGTWAVIDTDGRYDSSNRGDIEWPHGVTGYDIIPLKQLLTAARPKNPIILWSTLKIHE